MTICIAAICDYGAAVVSASDRMISWGYAQAGDSMVTKAVRVHEKWAALFAADDVTSVDPILRSVTKSLSPLAGEIDEATSTFRNAYQNELRKRAETQVLSQFGMSLDRFLQEGLKKFGREVFSSLCEEIRSVKLGCDFLVHGFDPGGHAHIFTVQDPGEATEHNRTGFWAIGSGQQSAISILFHHSYSAEKSLEEAIYHICEAKFMAETALGVGKETVLGVLRSNQTGGLFRNDQLEPIRKRWEQEGRPKVPADITRAVSDMIAPGLSPVQPFIA